MNCLLQAACRAFNVEPDAIIKFLDHDGEQVSNKIGWPVGFHFQEIARYAYACHGKHLVPVEPEFGQQTPDGDIFHHEQRDYYRSRLYNQPAILEGYTSNCGHAAYWDGERIYDTKPDQNFQVTCAWLIL
jgi:hypothetical protein